jgi:hypothetical protein
MQVVTRIPQFRYTQQDANLFRLRQLACLMFLVSLRSLWRKTDYTLTLPERISGSGNSALGTDRQPCAAASRQLRDGKQATELTPPRSGNYMYHLL